MWNLTWDKCVVEPTCDDLPDPEQEAPDSGLRLKDKGVAKVKVGDSVTFECINRGLYQVSEINLASPGNKTSLFSKVSAQVVVNRKKFFGRNTKTFYKPIIPSK